MFLNKLTKKEKKAFLQLAYYVALSDGDFSDKQKNIIQIYTQEMGIKDKGFKKDKFNLKKTLSKFKTKKSQRVAFLELLALVYSDFIVHKAEKEIIEVMLEEFQIDSKTFLIYSEWTKAILALSSEGELLLEL